MKRHLLFPLTCLLFLSATLAISGRADAAQTCNNKVCTDFGTPHEVCVEQINGPSTTCTDSGTCSWDTCP
jgi:hypothetical protein